MVLILYNSMLVLPGLKSFLHLIFFAIGSLLCFIRVFYSLNNEGGCSSNAFFENCPQLFGAKKKCFVLSRKAQKLVEILKKYLFYRPPPSNFSIMFLEHVVVPTHLHVGWVSFEPSMPNSVSHDLLYGCYLAQQ